MKLFTQGPVSVYAFAEWMMTHFLTDFSREREYKRLLCRRTIAEIGNHWRTSASGKFPLPNEQATAEFTHRSSSAWTWWCIINRLGSAVLLMEEAGLEQEVIPLCRTAIEHMVYLVALLSDDGPEFAAARRLEDVRAANALIREAATGIWRLADRSLDAIAVSRPPADLAWTRTVDGICRRLKIGSSVYAYYRLLSNSIHPNVTNNQAFTRGPSTDATQLSLLPRHRIDVDVLHWVAACQIWAGRAILRLGDDEGLATLLDLAERELGVPDITDMGDDSPFGQMKPSIGRSMELFIEPEVTFSPPGRRSYEAMFSAFDEPARIVRAESEA